MANKMLIDAAHPEETRVVVVHGNRIEEFDYEAQTKRQLRGNIYLAKVTRVEPSLQAAFIDYGGNRHGFLAFSEIHPDYYQIPLSDRQALLEAEQAAFSAQAEEEESEDGRENDRNRKGGGRGRRSGRGRGGRRSRRDQQAQSNEGEEALASPESEGSLAPQTPGEASEATPETDAPQASETDDTSLACEPNEDIGSDLFDAEIAGPDRAATDEAANDKIHERADQASEPDEEESPPSADQAAPAQPLSNGKADASVSLELLEPETDPLAAPTAPNAEDPDVGVDEAEDDEDQDEDQDTTATQSADGSADGEEENPGVEADDETGSQASIWEAAVEGSIAFARAGRDGYLPEDDDEDDLPSPAKLRDAAVLEDDDDEEDDEDEDTSPDSPPAKAPRRRRPHVRRYKIQEVIKKRQIMLVQVVKEERGNKGAALTTYLSLAGRYSVLMPNTGKGGGISRKITNPGDRKRLKEIAGDLEVPLGMGLIIRTAGANRTKAEIKRDYEYLLRLWESIRELTLRSTAPTLVYEEGNLIKRAIRDLYSKDIETVMVQGERAYREAKDFMRMLIPSHAKNVRSYREPVPLFQRHQVEPQLDSMVHPVVQLRSGGYLVINPTEALVAIDVNSGKATREHSIEETALQTNLEAAEEVARQLRLRDLAGLIVIDFIDMEDYRNNRAVERRLKDCLKQDRARLQVGRISTFGLLEMSRQRLRAGVMEGVSVPCSHCGGTGTVPSVASAALSSIRGLEAEAVSAKGMRLELRTSPDVALYLLNMKRQRLAEVERAFATQIEIVLDEDMLGRRFEVSRSSDVSIPVFTEGEDVLGPEHGFANGADDEADETAEPERVAEDAELDQEGEESDRDAGRGKRRRRRRGGRRDQSDTEVKEAKAKKADAPAVEETTEGAEENTAPSARAGAEDPEADANGDGQKKRRRRGRRGGRRHRRDRDDAVTLEGADGTDESAEGLDPTLEEGASASEPLAASAEEASGSEKAPNGHDAPADDPSTEIASGGSHESLEAEGEQLPEEEANPVSLDADEEDALDSEQPEQADDQAADEVDLTPPPEQIDQGPTDPPRKGWWQRKFFS